MPSSTSCGPGASGGICPRTSRPRVPSGGTSTSGGTTAPPTRSTTGSARRSGRPRSRTRPAPPPAWTASRWTRPPEATERGRDNAKNVDGRKRHIVVDSLGLLLAVLVTAASVDDAKAAQELFPRLEGQPDGPGGDGCSPTASTTTSPCTSWSRRHARWDVVVVRRPDGSKGWVKLPIRWTVERTFAWLGKCRRLTTDREKSVRPSEAFVKLAMIHLMVNRLDPKRRMPSSSTGGRLDPPLWDSLLALG